MSEIKIGSIKEFSVQLYAASRWTGETASIVTATFDDGASVVESFNYQGATPQDKSGFTRPTCTTPDGKSHNRGFLYSTPVSAEAAEYMKAASAWSGIVLRETQRLRGAANCARHPWGAIFTLEEARALKAAEEAAYRERLRRSILIQVSWDTEPVHPDWVRRALAWDVRRWEPEAVESLVAEIMAEIPAERRVAEP